MEVKPIPENVLEAARKWFRNWGSEIMYYAGEEDGLYYFNGRMFDMSGKFGFGTPIPVTSTGRVDLIRDSRDLEVYKIAKRLNLPYDL